MLAAAAAAALVSCNKEIEKPEVPQESEGIKVTIVTGDPETKTYIEGTTPKWKATDAVGVFTGAAGANVKFTNTSANGAAAVFEGTVPASGTYYAYYPYSSATPNENGQYIQIPADQHPTPTSFDGATDILISESIEINTTDATNVNTRFRRLGSFLKFVFTDGTTGKRLSGITATKVSVIVDNTYGDGSYRPCPSVRVKPDGLGVRGAGMKTISANYGDGVFELTADGNAVYLGILPQPFATGSSFDITITAGDATIKKTVTLKKDFELTSGRILPVPITLEDADYPEKTVKIERVWGKYSTSDSYWNASFGGTASADRNIAMDDDYIYLPETTAAAKLWMIPLDGTTDPSLANVEGVSGGTHALSCVRIVPNTSSKVNGGKDFLMACNLTTNSESTALTVYSWNNGTSNAPVSESVSNGRGLRIGDKFSVYGSLQDGALFFRNWNGTDGWGGKGTILVLRMAWADVPSGGYFNPRITFSYEDGGINAYYPYPGDASNGFIANVSATGKYASFTNSPLNTSPNSSGSFTESSGYYENTAGYNFLEYNGKRYVAYVKNAGGGDGRFYILQGETTDSWEDILESKRKVIYQAAIQQDLAYADGDYHEDLAKGVTKTSANSALDCTARIIGEDLYFAVLKQGVGLSLFKMYMK